MEISVSPDNLLAGSGSSPATQRIRPTPQAAPSESDLIQEQMNENSPNLDSEGEEVPEVDIQILSELAQNAPSAFEMQAAAMPILSQPVQPIPIQSNPNPNALNSTGEKDSNESFKALVNKRVEVSQSTENLLVERSMRIPFQAAQSSKNPAAPSIPTSHVSVQVLLTNPYAADSHEPDEAKEMEEIDALNGLTQQQVVDRAMAMLRYRGSVRDREAAAAHFQTVSADLSPLLASHPLSVSSQPSTLIPLVPVMRTTMQSNAVQTLPNSMNAAPPLLLIPIQSNPIPIEAALQSVSILSLHSSQSQQPSVFQSAEIDQIENAAENTQPNSDQNDEVVPGWRKMLDPANSITMCTIWPADI